MLIGLSKVETTQAQPTTATKGTHMADLRLIRSDEYGPYVLTGGYAFRPQNVARKHFSPYRYPDTESRTRPTRNEPGTKIKATHIGGTGFARVGPETWVSADDDPQYIAYAPKNQWFDEEVPKA